MAAVADGQPRASGGHGGAGLPAVPCLPRGLPLLAAQGAVGVAHRAAGARHLLARDRRRLPHVPRQDLFGPAAHGLHLRRHRLARRHGRGVRADDDAVERVLPGVLDLALQRSDARAALLVAPHAMLQGLQRHGRAEEPVERAQVRCLPPLLLRASSSAVPCTSCATTSCTTLTTSTPSCTPGHLAGTRRPSRWCTRATCARRTRPPSTTTSSCSAPSPSPPTASFGTSSWTGASLTRRTRTQPQTLTRARASTPHPLTLTPAPSLTPAPTFTPNPLTL